MSRGQKEAARRERERLATALRESEGRLQRLIEDLQVGILIQGKRSQILFANRAALEMLGLSEEELLGFPSLDAASAVVREDGTPFPGVDHPGALAIATGRPVHNVVMGFERASAKDRVWLLVSADPQLEADGSVSHVICTLSDITARKTVEERLRESEARYRQLVEKAQDMIYRTDTEGHFTYVNPVTSGYLGYPETELVGRHFSDLVRPDHRERVTALLARQLRERLPTAYDEFAAVGRGGREIWIGQNVQLLTEGERIRGFQAVARDITERKLAQEALEKTARLKDQFLANMSHELRTPLSEVLGMTQLLLSTHLDELQRDYAEQIGRSGRQFLEVVDRILDYARLESGTLRLDSRDFDLGAVVDDVLGSQREAAEDKGLEIVGEISSEVPRGLRGDPDRLRQILGHLVANAVKFSLQGKISLRVSLASDSAEGTIVRFKIADTGVGISPTAQARLFEPFVQADSSSTRKHGGTGLGLAISKRLVEAMHGEIGVKSHAGRGSTFWFTARLETATPTGEVEAEAAAPAPAEPAAAPGTPPLVLVVEDNPVNQKVTVALLENLGYRVETANDGLEAVAACVRRTYDAILMDCQMPQMDGFKATAGIRDREGASRRTPIIALTASVLPGDREKCLAAGMDDYLSKPVGVRALEAALRKWIPRAGAAPRAAEAAPMAHVLPADHPLRPLEVQGRAHVVAEIIDLFLETTPTRLAVLRQAQLKADAPSVLALAHSLKGAAVQLGVRGVADLCAQIQATTRAGNLEAAGELLHALEAEYRMVSVTLQGERQRLADPIREP